MIATCVCSGDVNESGIIGITEPMEGVLLWRDDRTGKLIGNITRERIFVRALTRQKLMNDIKLQIMLMRCPFTWSLFENSSNEQMILMIMLFSK